MQNEQVETVKRVSREKASKYVKYFSTIYQINEKVQPNFWEAVIMLCENPNCDINLLNIDSSNEAKWCIGIWCRYCIRTGAKNCKDYYTK